jgi:DNA repair photolyase
MANPIGDRPKGRGTPLAPPNRFEAVRVEDDFEQLESLDSGGNSPRAAKTEFLPDHTKTIICENDSPDIPFRYSINPYRGCEHGCAYCYARPYHELLGMNAGLDFETKILVKQDGAKLLRRELARPSWRGEPITISGVTDCYQPAERRFGVTRGLLEVLSEARQATGLITKNALILRDLDLLAAMAERNLVQAAISLTTLDAELGRVLEPRTSSPEARLRAISELSAAGVHVRVMTAPLIPGLNDQELPELLSAARDAGAQSASFTLLRLPLAVAPVFLDWLDAHRPLLRSKVEALVREARDGKLNTSRFGNRMRGEGVYAEGVRNTFKVFCRKLGYGEPVPLDTSQFCPPMVDGQLRLF